MSDNPHLRMGFFIGAFYPRLLLSHRTNNEKAWPVTGQVQEGEIEGQ